MLNSSEIRKNKDGDSQKIGEILKQIGMLNDAQVADIMAYQDKHSKTFGDAAIELGFLGKKDLEYALSLQFNYAVLEYKSNNHLSEELLVAREPKSIQAETFRILRSQIMLNCLEKGRRAIVIASPSEGCGCTYVTVNLGIALAQLNLKTCIVDSNLRNPRVSEIFGINNRNAGLSNILRGGVEYDEVVARNVFPCLSILTAGPIPPNPQELLTKPELIWTLSHLLREFDVVLFDTPPMNTSADVRTISARVGTAMMVVKRHHSLANDVNTATLELENSGAELIGTVLNQF